MKSPKLLRFELIILLDVEGIPANQGHPKTPSNVQKAPLLSPDKYEKALQRGILRCSSRLRSSFIRVIRKPFLRGTVTKLGVEFPAPRNTEELMAEVPPGVRHFHGQHFFTCLLLQDSKVH